MRRFTSLLLLLCLSPGLAATATEKKEPEPADAPPQLISTKGGGLKWKNLKELTAIAEKGDPPACFELGARLLEGDSGLPADPARARVLFEQAGRGGVAGALFRLGKIHHDGLGVPRDYAKALEYYTAAARRGVPEAQHNIGAMLVSARGVKRDYVEGLAWLILANKSGAVSDAETQVRTRLAQRPADIKAAEIRAIELMADLANATVRARITETPSSSELRKLLPPPVTPAPLDKIPIPAPALEPVPPPAISVPLDLPPPTPR